MTSEMVEVVTGICIHCGQAGVVSAPSDEVEAYEHGIFIQHAFISLSDSEREQIMTGIHGECWDKMFPEEEGY